MTKVSAVGCRWLGTQERQSVPRSARTSTFGSRLRGTTAVSSHAETGATVKSVAIQTSIGPGNRVGL